MSEDIDDLIPLGYSMSHADAAICEAALAISPDCLKSRAKLIGYHLQHYHCCPHTRSRRVEHIKWMIAGRHMNYIRSGYIRVHLVDKDAYEKIKSEFERVVCTAPNDTQLLIAMASFISHQEPYRAIELLRHCETLEPSNSHFRELAENILESMPMMLSNIETYKNEPGTEAAFDKGIKCKSP
ncbi:MAG: hypothetical protein P4L53_24440 [Candidatus Obscuribacterales bacterium]|nr:hypothetical protein [Candidatus Obscuribacterales bacterium]